MFYYWNSPLPQSLESDGSVFFLSETLNHMKEEAGQEVKLEKGERNAHRSLEKHDC
jgi:hypothetical protein